MDSFNHWESRRKKLNLETLGPYQACQALNVEISLVGQRRATQSNASPSAGVSYSWVRGLEFY